MVLAVGTGRALRALPKANQPRGGGGFIGKDRRLSSKQAWRFSPAPRGYVHNRELRLGKSVFGGVTILIYALPGG